MTKLFEIIGLHAPIKGDFGIEIEVEGRKLPDHDTDFWKTVEDGSLRNGLEYVVRGAISNKGVVPALSELQSAFIDNGSRLSFSFRTSVHVHMNMQQLTMNEIFNCIYTYLLLEDSFMNYCGEQRKGNRFCLRAADAEFSYDVIEKLFRDGAAGLIRIPHNQARYAAINIEALSKYGSLEFRGMEGNMDIPRISNWCSALLALRNFAQKHKTPMDIYNAFDNQASEEFLVSVLGDLSKLFTFPDMDRAFKRSFSLAISLPFAFKEGEAARNRQYKKENGLILKGEL